MYSCITINFTHGVRHGLKLGGQRKLDSVRLEFKIAEKLFLPSVKFEPTSLEHSSQIGMSSIGMGCPGPK